MKVEGFEDVFLFVAIFVFCITFFLVSLRMIFLEFLEHDGTYDKRYSKLYQRVAIGRQ
jgi:hypothetical protein